VDGGVTAMQGAHEHLVRLCRQLSASQSLANGSLAELITCCVFEGKPQLWQQLRAQFGMEGEFPGVPSGFLHYPWDKAEPMDASEQQQLFGRAVVAHRKTVEWVYKVGLILDSQFADDEQYQTWRSAEDRFEARLKDLSRSIDMPVLARALS